MGNNIKLSIIIPIYKVEEYLPRCLDSLVNQTLKDIELICINDGSPDNCINILKEYKEKYGEKIVIIDKKNEGVWRGRKDGIKIAKGEYIGFIDSDDYVGFEYAEKLYNAAKTNNADMSVCGFSRIDMETGQVYSKEMCKERKDILINENPDDLLAINGAPWNKIFKAHVLKEMAELKNPPKILDDMMFQLTAYLNVEKIVFIPDILIYYMVRGTSIINNIKKEQLQSTYDAMLEVKEIYLKDKRKDIFLPILEAHAYLHLGISLMFRMSYDKSCNLKETIRSNEKFLNENFPSWRKIKFLKLSYIIKHKSSNLKMGIMNMIYKLGMFRMFLAVYKFMIDKLKIDIKW